MTGAVSKKVMCRWGSLPKDQNYSSGILRNLKIMKKSRICKKKRKRAEALLCKLG